jgi:hypothetical protein
MKALFYFITFVASFAMFVMYSMDYTPKGIVISGALSVGSILLLKKEQEKQQKKETK